MEIPTYYKETIKNIKFTRQDWGMLGTVLTAGIIIYPLILLVITIPIMMWGLSDFIKIEKVKENEDNK